MDKKYTSLESTIRNVVRGSTGAAQDNRSLESKIRSVVLKEEVSINEAPDDAAPPGDGHLSVHELFGHLREYNEDHDRSTDPDDPDEESVKESRADINSTEKMIRKIHGQDTLDHVRNAIESERHIRLGTNPGVNNHQAVKDHLDAAVRASRHFSEALGTGGNESSETMKKEGYIITPSGRKPLINEAELEEGSEKFAKIMARTAAKKGEPITTDTTELEKKHDELLQNSRDAADRAKQARTDYETLAKKYGITPEPIGEEASINEEGKGAIGIIDAGLKYAPKILPEIGAGVKTVIKKLDNWSPPGWSARVEKGAGSTELALPSPKTVTAPTKAPDISFQPPVAKTGTDVAIPGQPSMPKPNAKVDIPNAVGPTVTPPKIATPKPTIFAKPKNITEPVTKPGVSSKPGSVPKPGVSSKPGSVPKAGGGRIGRIAKGIGAAEIADFLFGGSGGAAAIPNNNDGAPAGDRIDLSRNRHYAKARQVYGQEIHYNEYEPDGDYIGEDSAEQTDAERSAIENVARPNSKNKLTKNAELRNKIIEDTQRRKAVILRAKEENKNGKDGANSDVETKPELKRVDVNEITGSDVATGARKVLGKTGKVVFGPLGSIAGAAYDAKTAIDAGEDPERVALRTGLGAAGGAAGGLGGGILGTAVAPGPGTFVGGLAGSVGGSELGDYVGRKLYDTGIYGKGKALAKGAVDTVSGAADAVSDAADAVSDTASSAYNKLKGAFSSPTLAGGGGTVAQPKSSTPAPAVSLAGGGGMIGQKPLAPSTPTKPTTNIGKVGGTAAGKAITKVVPKPALKLPGPGTPGYRTDAQMNDYEAKRAEMLNKYPNSVGAQSAGNRSVEAATKSLNTNTPAVAPQPSPGINSTNTETPRTMGSSWNNSYKNKYSMGPGPSQFPSK